MDGSFAAALQLSKEPFGRIRAIILADRAIKVDHADGILEREIRIGADVVPYERADKDTQDHQEHDDPNAHPLFVSSRVLRHTVDSRHKAGLPEEEAWVKLFQG